MLRHKALIRSFIYTFIHSFMHSFTFNMCRPQGSPGTAKAETLQVDNMLLQAGCVVITPLLRHSPS